VVIAKAWDGALRMYVSGLTYRENVNARYEVVRDKVACLTLAGVLYIREQAYEQGRACDM
jgi:hypothetical protein